MNVGVLKKKPFVLFLYFYVNGILNNIKTVYIENGNISTNISLLKTGVADYNYSQQFSEYAYINYKIKNATKSKIFIALYQSNPIMKIYLINPINSCYNCFNLNAIETNISRDLSSYGLIFNSSSFQTISIFNMSEIAPDSIVILPTGLLPASILPYTGFTNNGKNIIQLINQND